MRSRISIDQHVLAVVIATLLCGSPTWSATHTVTALDYQPWYEPVGVVIDVDLCGVGLVELGMLARV